jgi:hypothetical protein
MVALYPEFQPKVANSAYGDEGKVLLSEMDVLSKLAVDAGVKLLMAFGDNREIPEGFDGDPDELEDLMGPFDEWFPATEGLASVEGILALVRSTKKIKWVRYDRDTVMGALELVRDWLNDGAKVKAKFRFEVY